MDVQPLIENDTGRSAELFDEIKNLYIDFLKQFFCWKPKEKNLNLYSIIPKAEQQFNKLLNEMEVIDNKNYFLGVALKIFIQFNTLSQLFVKESVETFEKDGLPYLKNALELMESLKLQPEILLLYMLCADMMGDFHEKKAKSKMSFELIVKNVSQGVRAYDDYHRSKTIEAWDLWNIATFSAFKNFTLYEAIIKIFIGKNPYLEAKTLYRKMVIDLVRISVELNDKENIIEKGALAVKYIFEDKHPMQDDVQYFYVDFMTQIVTSYIKKNYLNQAMHLLAVTMYKVVEYRRLLPENSRNIINKPQAWISFLYSMYGFALLCMGLKLFSVKTLIPTCERVFESEELAIYEKQFPTEIVTDIKTLKTIYKKTISWLERAEQLAKSASTLDEELISAINDIKTGFLDIKLKLLSLNA